MLPIAIAVCLTHDGFGAILLAFHKAIGTTRWQKLEKGKNFLSPILECRERLAHLVRPLLLDMLNPGIEFSGGSGHSRRGIPATQRFFELSCHLQQRKLFPKSGALFHLFLAQILFCLQEEVLLALQERFPFFFVSPA